MGGNKKTRQQQQRQFRGSRLAGSEDSNQVPVHSSKFLQGATPPALNRVLLSLCLAVFLILVLLVLTDIADAVIAAIGLIMGFSIFLFPNIMKIPERPWFTYRSVTFGLVSFVIFIGGLDAYLASLSSMERPEPPLQTYGDATSEVAQPTLDISPNITPEPTPTEQIAAKTNKIVILVANFDGSNTEYGVTDKVLHRLRMALRRYNDVEVQSLGRTITETEGGSNAARSEGEQRNATIVLWGSYKRTAVAVDIIVTFEVLKPSKALIDLGLETMDIGQTVDVAQMDTFKMQTQLSEQMAYLSLFTVGTVRYTVGDWDGAIEGFSDALLQTSERAEVLDQSIIYFWRGSAYHFKGNIDDAISDYTKSVDLQPNYFEAYNDRGLAYLDRKDFDRALNDFNESLRLKPDNAETYNDRGVLYLQRGDFDLALNDFNESIDIEPNYISAYNNRGNAYLFKEDYDQALSNYEHVIKYKPDSGIYYNRGLVYLNKRDYDRAINDFGQSISLEPDNFKAYRKRGLAYLNKNDPDRAIPDFDQSIKLESNNNEAFRNRGASYAKKSDYDRAIADFNQAINLSPDDVRAYYNRGCVYRSKGDYDNAIADQTEVLKRDPKNIDAYLCRADSYADKGEVDNAIADYGQVIAAQPGNIEIYHRRVMQYVKKNNHDGVINDSSIIIKLNPNDILAYQNRGTSYYYKGEYDSAIADFNQIISIQPNYGVAYYNRGSTYAAMKGHEDRAVADLNKFLQMSADPDLRARAEMILDDLDAK